MLLLLAVLLAIAWIFGFSVFHITAGAINWLIIVAVIALVAHAIRGKPGKTL